MEDTNSVATLLESTTSKIQQLQKAFAELESHRAVTLNLKWKQIEEHFHGLEKSLKRRFTELEDQEKEFEMKTVKAQQVLEKRHAAVMAKEEASLVRLQEKRDVAVAAIINSEQPEKPSVAMISESEENEIKKIFKKGDIKLSSNPELAKLCEEMDAKGLLKFISDNRKNLASIKEEIPIALKSANNPGVLVLDSLNGFYIPEISNSDSKKDSNLLGIRRTCIMLMECLSILLTNLDKNTICEVISEDVKNKAKIIAHEWKPKLDNLDLDDSNGNSLEAHAFLQLVATFRINSDFVNEDLVKLIPMVSRRHQTADLCRFLGLSDKMPGYHVAPLIVQVVEDLISQIQGVIDVLVNNGRHIDAVNLAFAFELTQRFSPVTLLKSYLTEAVKVPSTPTAQNDVSERELSDLKAITKCIEEHKLENEYPIDPLQKRILHLEKVKSDKKQATEIVKPQSKRPRANGIAPAYGPRNTRYAPPPQAPTQYIYDNRPTLYAYHAPPPETHVHTFLGAPTYGMAPNHGNYFGNGYQYQAPYLH